MTGLKLVTATALVSAMSLPTLGDFSGSPQPVSMTRTQGYFQGNGGEFTIAPGLQLSDDVSTGLLSDIGASWQSFCVERNEYVNTPGNYYGDINTFSTGGGVGGHDGNQGPNGESTDSLDPRTAYLYQNFRQGTLATSYSYDPNNGRSGDAGALQKAIWYIEGELNNINGKARTLYNEAVEATEIGQKLGGGSTDGDITWAGLGNVRIMNMWGDATRTQFKQDQLVLLVPAPGAILLGTIGLAAAGWFRFRKA